MVEGTILVDNRPTIALFDPSSMHSFIALVFSCDMQDQIMQLPYDFTLATPSGKIVVCELYIPSAQ